MASQSKQRRTKLHASSVYVRVLPGGCSSGHIDQEDENDAIPMKQLHGWTDASIQLRDRHGMETYTFPRKVLPPEISQEEAYQEMLPHFVKRFTMPQGYNVLFFAYGQTGTGKTHTIFGPNSALEHGNRHPEWGIFPRIVHDTLDQMNARPTACKFRLFASALEFYLGGCHDLLNQNKGLTIGLDFAPQGHTMQRIHSTDDLIPFLAHVRANRTVRSTKMNARTNDSEGSSRSHCALMLTLMQIDESEKYTKTTFTLVDFAGAERPDKNDEERKSGMDVMWELYKGNNELSTGSQGFLINYELFEIRSAVIQATEIHLKRQRYSPKRQCATMFQKFVASCMDGNALLGNVITISQARRNGWETWFTMQYGTDLSRLRAPCHPQPSVPINIAMKKAKVEKDIAAELLKKTPKEGKPSSKYYPQRRAVANELRREYDVLRELCEPTKTTMDGKENFQYEQEKKSFTGYPDFLSKTPEKP